MEISFVTATMAGGGTERVISVLANRFAQDGHLVTVMMTAGENSVYPLEPEVELFSVGGQTGRSIYKRIERIKKMRNFFKQHPKTVICAMGIETNLFTVLASRGLKNTVIVSERNDPNQCGYKTIRNFIYGMADVLVCQTEDAAACFSKCGMKSIRVIPNPVDPNLPKPFHGERKKQIVAAGRLTAQKNQGVLLEAFALFCEEYKDYSLTIYGKGELEQTLKEHAQNLGIAERVNFPGFVKALPEKIQDAAMYILSSDYEGISNSLSEAMAIGLSVISTDCPIGGSKMCIRDGQNGLLVPVGDVKALAEAMKRLAHQPEFAEKLGKEAEKIREDYSVDSISNMWMECMRG